MVFDIKPDDVYWCAADIGWVTGHSYIVYGPLANATTGVMYEGAPDTPAWDRWWQIIEDYKVSILYCAPTAIRAFMKQGAQYAAGARPVVAARPRLGRRADQPRGVALVPRAHRRRPDARSSTPGGRPRPGMIMITPLPGVTTTKPGSAPRSRSRASRRTSSTRDGDSVPLGGGGYLVLKRPWPAMLRGIYGDPERYKQTYWSRFPGMYFAGDGAKRDEDGYLWLLGRVDDVMNVAGHRICTTEVESALVDHQSVAEAAVVGKNDAITGQAIFAFVILKVGEEPIDALAAELREHVAKVIGPIAQPKFLMFVPDLPKTRSGKIMRRLLRDIAEGRVARRHDDARRCRRRRDDPRRTPARRRSDVPFDFLKRKKDEPAAGAGTGRRRPPAAARGRRRRGHRRSTGLTEEWRLVGRMARRGPAVGRPQQARADRHQRRPAGRPIDGSAPLERGARPARRSTRTT